MFSPPFVPIFREVSYFNTQFYSLIAEFKLAHVWVQRVYSKSLCHFQDSTSKFDLWEILFYWLDIRGSVHHDIIYENDQQDAPM